MSLEIEEDSQESETTKNDDRYLVPGLVRGLAILQAFNQQAQEMTITEIAEILEVNRSSAFRLIYTLEACGYLRKASQKTYALDSKVMELACPCYSYWSNVIIRFTRGRSTTTLSQF